MSCARDDSGITGVKVNMRIIEQFKKDKVLHERGFGMRAPGGHFEEKCMPIQEPTAVASGKYRDAITGQVLVDKFVEEMRRLEWALRGQVECFGNTGKPPITVQWVDVSEGDDFNANYRSRLVARQMKKKGVERIFAGTPALEAIRSVISMAAAECGEWTPGWDPLSKRRTQILSSDRGVDRHRHRSQMWT